MKCIPNEMHAREMHAREMHAREMHAHKTHAHEMHAHETHASRSPILQTVLDLSRSELQKTSFCASCGVVPIARRRQGTGFFFHASPTLLIFTCDHMIFFSSSRVVLMLKRKGVARRRGACVLFETSSRTAFGLAMILTSETEAHKRCEQFSLQRLQSLVLLSRGPFGSTERDSNG
jgi:hypothetical protein